MSNDSYIASIPAKPAGFWLRFLALILNLILFIPISWIVVIVSMHSVIPINLDNIALMVFSVIFLASHWQATPGKRFFSVYVIRAEDGGPIGLGRAFYRFFAFAAPYILYIIVIMAVTYIFPSFRQPTVEKPSLETMFTLPMIIVMISSISLSIFYIALPFSIIFDPNKRSFIDKLCRTCVVCGRPKKL
jgi:uncharacterized RDD family membrane protein YckC